MGKGRIIEDVKRVISIQEGFSQPSSDYENKCLEFFKSFKLDFMWEDGWLKENFNLIERFSLSDEPVLIIGESGVGKEIISRLIHFLSKRRRNPFYPINCSSLNENLFQSELFGHEKGSFTSAHREREGIAKSANGGTIFLDEIQCSSAEFQNSLLRFLDRKERRPLGSDIIDRVDVRIIVGCCGDMEEFVKIGKIYEPFYYRISSLELSIPPLREREDIEKYIYYFLIKESHKLGEEEKEISPSALEALKRYFWEGNLREMRNIIHRIVLLSDSRAIELKDLPEKIRNPESSKILFKSKDISGNESLKEMLFNFEREIIIKTLEENNWNITRASKALKISRQNFQKRMRKFKLK